MSAGKRIYELLLSPSETILARSLTRGTAATEEALLNYITAWLSSPADLQEGQR